MQRRIDALVADQRVWWGLGIVAVCAFAAGVSWWGYQRYVLAHNQRAQWALSQQLEKFESVLQTETEDRAVWRDLEQGFEKAFELHRTSSIAPFFRAYQAEAAFRAGDPVHAYELLTLALDAMGKNFPLYYPYAVKRAVWLLGMPEETLIETLQGAPLHEVGIQQLKVLAQDQKNPDPGLAWYHLWQYGLVHNNKDLTSMAAAKLQGIAHWEYVLHDSADQGFDETLNVEMEETAA